MDSEAPITEADLDRWDVITDNASRGPWEWWTSNSFRRLSGPSGKDGDILHAVVSQYDRHPDVSIREEDMDFIEEARDAMPQLLAEVRRLRALAVQGATKPMSIRNTSEVITGAARDLDAALEVLRPFARWGRAWAPEGYPPKFVAARQPDGTPVLTVGDCVAAWEFWQAHRQEEP